MPVKKKDGRKRKGPAPATKARRKAAKGNRGPRSREKETPKKRKARSNSSSPRPSPSVAPTRTPINRQAKKAGASPSSAKAKEDTLVFSLAFKLAAAMLSGCPHGIWWRITPDPLKRDDTSVGSRQCWDDILPTFIDAGLFGTRQVDKLGIEHRIEPRKKQFDILATYLEGLNDLKLQWTCVEPRRGRKSWHVVLSDVDSKQKHRYSNPIVQQEMMKDAESLVPSVDSRLLRSRKANDKDLKEELDKLRKEVAVIMNVAATVFRFGTHARGLILEYHFDQLAIFFMEFPMLLLADNIAVIDTFARRAFLESLTRGARFATRGAELIFSDFGVTFA